MLIWRVKFIYFRFFHGTYFSPKICCIFRKKITSSELSGFTKVQFKARGNNEKYFLHIKTKGSIFPWVRYLAEFEVSEEWKDYEIKFSEFVKFSNKRQKKNTLNPF